MCTYRSPHRENFSPPYDTSNFAQMDFFLVNEAWKNSIQNIETKDGTPFESDHKAILVTTKIKMAKKKKKQEEDTPKRYRKPNSEQLKEYNTEIRKVIAEYDKDAKEINFEEWANTLKEAAEATLVEIPKEQKNHIYQNRPGIYCNKKPKQKKKGICQKSRNSKKT